MAENEIPDEKMSGRRSFLDDTDMKILNILQRDCRKPLYEIAEELSIPKSTIHYRIKRLEDEGIIEGYYAKINSSKLGFDIQMIVNVRAKFGKGYHEKVGKKLAEIPGIWAVYFVFGENDFVILGRGKNRKELFDKMKILFNSDDVERTTTQIVTEVVKDDPRIFFNVEE